MSWKNVANVIKGVAPQLAGMLLGGPAGAVAGKLLGDFLGVEPEPEKIEAVLVSDPNAMLKVKQLELETFQTKADVLKSALVQDSITPHTTRPKIAYGSFLVSSFASLIAIAVWGYGVINDTVDLENSWPFMATVIAPFVVVIHAYMGILRDEHANKVNASNGLASNASGLLSRLLKR